jgi:predicted anti-sigma-YlaC factor YlaD
MLTLKRLREALYYDADLGWFMWRVPRPGTRAGDVAGCFTAFYTGRTGLLGST